MFRIVIACTGIPAQAGPETAIDITNEFAQHRTWHQNASCKWDGSRLILCAENDFDPEGKALLDEFSDCVAAYVAGIVGPTRLEVLSRDDV
jgi:hypothetical protein